MKKMVLDSLLRAKLDSLNEELELCDEAGQTLGHFMPEKRYRELMYAVAWASCPHTEEELQQLQHQTGGKPLAEIWKSLGQS